ncbi:hypothetical protein EON66_09475 [archaeon]|nr:MAG: hypothetical protein EON66_09475 [archaeon]
MYSSLIPVLPAGVGPFPAGADGSPLPVGLLAATFRLRPLLQPSAVLPKLDVEYRLSQEAARAQDAFHKFTAYARGWWAEYKAVHPSYAARPVKIFGHSERGEYIPVSTLVRPLPLPRDMPSPMHAARFVSLLPLRRREPVVGGAHARIEVWHAPHITLAMRQGDIEDHAVLLAGLLLSFGLDAYVAVGSRTSVDGVVAPYAWVVTRDVHEELSRTAAHATHAHSAQNFGYAADFWDAVSGERVHAGEALLSGDVLSHVACVFNGESFFANHALDDRCSAASWDWSDLRQWKSVRLPLHMGGGSGARACAHTRAWSLGHVCAHAHHCRWKPTS